MLKAFKYELAPTPEQATHLNKVLGCVRMVYNLGLETKQQAYTKGKNVSGFELMKQLTDLKQEYDWLYEAPTHALQHALTHLDVAYTNFFKKRAAFPRFKSKKGRQSFHLPAGVKVRWKTNEVFLPKLKWVVFHNSRSFTGKIRNATVSRTPTGRYFVSILVETGTALPPKKPIIQETAVGIDVGLKHFVILSDGKKIENPRWLKNASTRLRVEQRTMSRRFRKGAKEQSKSYEKQRRLVACLHEHVANQRKDFLHKVSTAIVKQYDSVCVEDLNVAGMVKNRSLARSISDVGWATFRTFLTYKCEWYGKNLHVLGRFEPSSKLCSACGKHKGDLKLSERTWACTDCGVQHDRDINAAINIKTYGLGTKPLSANVAH